MSNAEGTELAQRIIRQVVKLSAPVCPYITSSSVGEIDVPEIADDELVYYRFHFDRDIVIDLRNRESGTRYDPRKVRGGTPKSAFIRASQCIFPPG